ncbi:MAG: YbaK/EbsC family protein [Acidimicrobiia bacterium]|nr:YbaK/EbsC family protein [Acidimicrobiia bacterium]
MSGPTPAPAHDLPAATLRFLEQVGDVGIAIAPVVFPADTRTSQQAADALACHVSKITKSLVFMADDSPLMVLMAGDRRVDLDRVAAIVGAQSVRRAELDEARDSTGFSPGGTPPFGHVKAMEVLADRSITGNDVVWVAAGSPKTVFAIGVNDLVRLSDARLVDVAEEV